jgi:hypothetical protein
MEPKNDLPPPEQPPQAELPAPKKRFQLKRFQIAKLEERIAPGKTATSSGSFTVEKHCSHKGDCNYSIE